MTSLTPPAKVLILSIRGDGTPYHDDPSNAGEFYQAIGTLIVSWGRLEEHLVTDLLMIRKLPGAPKMPAGFPISFKQLSKYWRAAFGTMDVLQPIRERVLAFIEDAGKHIKSRNFAGHTMWRDFARTELPTVSILEIEPLDTGAKWHNHPAPITALQDGWPAPTG
ncbi:MAG TPA: hypothetical protein VGN83_09220 [Falsiroseomonas sp.]|jgi:hypothetical protein|nr:hypothetical protein [Falsiroseomonas sp.]